MKYKFCSIAVVSLNIRINVTKYDVMFATKRGSNSYPSVVKPLVNLEGNFVILGRKFRFVLKLRYAFCFYLIIL